MPRGGKVHGYGGPCGAPDIHHPVVLYAILSTEEQQFAYLLELRRLYSVVIDS
jgi:hypothetical protein